MADILGLAGIFVAGILAGAINSVAGGGTLISFPSLVAFGESQIVSNATNTAALWPGSLSSAIGYRKDTPMPAGLLATLLIPSFIGGILGAWILVSTPPGIFNIVVPFLVLFATLLFAFQRSHNPKVQAQQFQRGIRLDWESHLGLLLPTLRGNLRRLFRGRNRHSDAGVVKHYGLARHSQDECDQDTACRFNQLHRVCPLRCEGFSSLGFGPSSWSRCNFRRLCGSPVS